MRCFRHQESGTRRAAAFISREAKVCVNVTPQVSSREQSHSMRACAWTFSSTWLPK
jgi:hypothetical protein